MNSIINHALYFQGFSCFFSLDTSIPDGHIYVEEFLKIRNFIFVDEPCVRRFTIFS